MASKFDTQSNHNNELTPFVIANDCPQENTELIYRIILNLKRSLFKETDHIQPNKNQPQPFDTLATSNTTE